MARARKSSTNGLYTWLIVFLGIGMLVAILKAKPLNIDLWREYAVFVALGVLAEWFAISIPQGSLSLGFAIICFSFIRFDVSATVVISFLSTVIANGIFYKEGLQRSTVFNSAQYVISAASAFAAYDYAGGQIKDKMSFENIPAVLVFVLAYFVVNHLLVIFYQWSAVRSQSRVVWKSTVKWDFITYVFAAPVGILMALIYEKTGLIGAVLLFIPLLTLKYLFRLYINVETANKELSALYQVAKNLGSSLDLSKTLGLILTETRKVISYDTGIIYLWDEEEKILMPTAIKSNYTAQLKNIYYHLGEGLIGSVAQAREPAIIYDSKTEPELRNIEGINQFLRSLMVIPLIVDKKLIGVIAIGKKEQYAFDPQKLQILTSLGGQAAVAMANAMFYKKLEKLAVTDGMTQLYNYRYFYNRIEEEGIRSKRYGTTFSLIMLDIDYFKKFNDKFGHRAGDAALGYVAKTILSGTRNIDTVSRYGGEEFAVLLPETGTESAKLVAERIRRAVQECPFSISEDLPPVSVTISMGIATCPQDTNDINELIEFADKALYYSKQTGRNKVSSWNELPVTDIK